MPLDNVNKLEGYEWVILQGFWGLWFSNLPTDIVTGPSSKSLRGESHCTALSKWRKHQLPLYKGPPVRRPSPGERNTTVSSRDHTLQLYNPTAHEGSSFFFAKLTNECYLRSPYSIVEDLANLKWAGKLVEDIHGRSQSHSICPAWLESYRERDKNNRSCHGNTTGRETVATITRPVSGLVGIPAAVRSCWS